MLMILQRDSNDEMGGGRCRDRIGDLGRVEVGATGIYPTQRTDTSRATVTFAGVPSLLFAQTLQ